MSSTGVSDYTAGDAKGSALIAWPNEASLVRASLCAQCAILSVAGAWLLVRALLLRKYSLVEFAVQGGAISLLTSMLLFARLWSTRRAATDQTLVDGPVALRRCPSRAAGLCGSIQFLARFHRARLVLAVTLFLAACFVLAAWSTLVAHGLYLRRLWRGLDQTLGIGLIAWLLCLIIAPVRAQAAAERRGLRLRAGINLAIALFIVWVYPYTDPFSRFVQWSGLYLPFVSALCLLNLVAWLRGDAWVHGWIDAIGAVLPVRLLPDQPHDPAGIRWLAGIVVAAVALRLLGVTWGLPPIVWGRDFRPIHPDEKVTYEQAWRLHLEPEPIAFVWGGCGYFRLGMFAKDLATYVTWPHSVPRLQILLLRALNILMAVACILVVYGCGLVLFNCKVGRCAAGLVAVFPGSVVPSHVARPEVLLTLLCALGLYAAAQVLTSGDWCKWLFWGGVVTGLAVGTKLTGVILIAPLGMAMGFRCPASRELAKSVVRIVLGGVFGYLLASFESVSFLNRLREGLELMWWLHGSREPTSVWTSAMGYLGPMSGYAWTVVGLVFLWIAAVVLGRQREGQVLVAFVVTGYVLASMQRTITFRSIVHLTPAVSLLVAGVWYRALQSTLLTHRTRPAAVTVIGISFLYIAQESVAHMCYLAFGRDVRSDAAQWIETHIPPDRRIGLSALYYGDWASCPPLDEYSRAVVVLPVGKGYDASDYIDRDLDYIVLSDLILQDVEPDSSVAAFCASLQAGPTYKLEQTFAPVFGGFRLCERLGWELPYDWLYTRPTFYVYARQKEMSH